MSVAVVVLPVFSSLLCHKLSQCLWMQTGSPTNTLTCSLEKLPTSSSVDLTLKFLFYKLFHC